MAPVHRLGRLDWARHHRHLPNVPASTFKSPQKEAKRTSQDCRKYRTDLFPDVLVKENTNYAAAYFVFVPVCSQFFFLTLKKEAGSVYTNPFITIIIQKQMAL